MKSSDVDRKLIGRGSGKRKVILTDLCTFCCTLGQYLRYLLHVRTDTDISVLCNILRTVLNDHTIHNSCIYFLSFAVCHNGLSSQHVLHIVLSTQSRICRFGLPLSPSS